jgi:hypothetical protein
MSHHGVPHPDYIQLLAELGRCQSHIAAREAEFDHLRRENSKLLHYFEESRQANKSLLLKHNDLTVELENTTNLSNARAKELASAQVFLSKADNISAAEVRDLVDALNEEIFQTAASLGDSIVRRKYNLSDEDQRSSRKQLHPIIGKGLLRILSAQGRNVNPLLVQVVAQVLLVDRCTCEIDDWDPNRPDLSSSLKELYRGMRGVGECFFINF